jgi:ribosome recycling factor
MVKKIIRTGLKICLHICIILYIITIIMPILNSQKIIEHYTKSISSIRTGNVNSSVLDHVFVDVYGSKMKIIELATINKPESAKLIVTPFDKGVNQAICKAIITANLGVNPVDNGAGIILNFPPLTQETRKLKIKELLKEEEKTKIVIRQDRQSLLNKAKKDKDAGELSEDELKKFEIELQKEVEKANKEIEMITKTKEQELLKV